jgi:uncharacterized protein (DUF924 family)
LNELQTGQREVLEFWFGADLGRAPAPPNSDWFGGREAFDEIIVARFGDLIGTALAGEIEHWPNAPLPALAYILVLDQFTRNAFRGTPRAFAGDPLALAAAQRAVQEGWHLHLSPLQRWFCYMPFEHSEELSDQQESLRLFGALRNDPPAAEGWPWAVRHHEVIERFGRFPHRNAILGRESTPEELAFLAQPGSRF